MEWLKDFLTGIVSSDAGTAFISFMIASCAATAVNIFLKNEPTNAPTWRRYVGMFLRALGGAVGENSTKKATS